jgi:hypothetical protein
MQVLSEAADTRRSVREAFWGYATPRFVDGLVFVLLLTGPPRMRVRDSTASLRGEADAAILIRLAVWGLGLLWLVYRLYPILVQRGMMPKIAAPHVITGLLVVVLIPGIWYSPGQIMTAYTIHQLALMLVFSWVFVQLYGPNHYFQHLFWGYLILSLGNVIAWFVMPELVTQDERLRGDLIAPSGPTAVMGIVLWLSGAVKVSRLTTLVAMVAFFTPLIMAQNRTSYVALALCLVIGLLFTARTQMRKAVVASMVAVILAAMLDVFATAQEHLSRQGEGISTMSDRIPLWNHVISVMLQESPVIGLGYFAASRIYAPQYNPGLGNAHSAFVEVFVGGGLIGGTLFLLLYVVLFAYVAKLMLHGRNSPAALAVVCLFVVVLLLSITNTEGTQPGPIGFTFWSTTALLPVIWSHVRDRRLSAATSSSRFA